MGKSRKKAIVKDIGHMKNIYWQVHRRTNKQILKNAVEIGSDEIPFKQPKELINDYDYVDVIWDFEHNYQCTDSNIATIKKYRRK